MRVRLRAPAGALTLTLADDATVSDLLSQITEKTSLSSFDIKYGYPPKPLLIEAHQKSQLLKELDVKLDGEQLTISAKDEPQEAITPKPYQQGDTPVQATKSTASSKKELIALKKKELEGDVPEIPFPERGATVGKLQSDELSPSFKSKS